MIVTFKSPAAGDVIMFGAAAHRLLQIMGKQPAEKGVVTVEQLPDAIARLRAAVAEDKTQQRAQRAAANTQDEDEKREQPAVSLAQRAVPLLELLEWSLKKHKPVTWGV